MEQMCIFDFIEQEQKPIYGPVIDDLVKELNTVFNNRKHKEGYYIWEHVKTLGYRLEYWVSVKPEEYDLFVEQLEKLKHQYAAAFLEISVMLTPDFSYKGNIRFFVSTLWKDKNRAKRG